MNVIHYLQGLGLPRDEALAKLAEEHGVFGKVHDETGLIVLNYSLINSDKRSPLVRECRSLVLDSDFNLVSRAFDRFLNYEEEKPDAPISEMVAYEKIDGSLVVVFWYAGKWMYRTRSVISPQQKVNGWDVTWSELIEQTIMSKMVDEAPTLECSYVFELTAPENRVVMRYAKREAYLLAIRHNETGAYVSGEGRFGRGVTPWPRPRMFTFDSYEACKEASGHLPDLGEGYVMYSREGAPVCKVKNPAYVAAHHLKGEGFTKARGIELVATGEVVEYLALFPEDAKLFEPIQDAWSRLHVETARLWSLNRGLEFQKDFAMAVKDAPVSGLVFSMRQGKTITEAMDKMTTRAKHRMIEAYLGDQ